MIINVNSKPYRVDATSGESLREAIRQLDNFTRELKGLISLYEMQKVQEPGEATFFEGKIKDAKDTIKSNNSTAEILKGMLVKIGPQPGELD